MREESGISANTVEGLSGPEEGDEIGLRAYALVLAAWWREIVLGAFLAVGGAAVLTLIHGVVSPTYEAAADLAIVDEPFSVDRKLTGLSLRDRGRVSNRTFETQRTTLLGLAKHESIAEEVSETLSGLLEGEQPSTPVTRPSISAELVNPGSVQATRTAGGIPSDLIRITARADSPEKASVFANAWAEEYLARANRLYAWPSSSMRSRVRTNLQRARKAYEDAQAELQAFQAVSRVDQLSRLIDENERKIADLQDTWRYLSRQLDNARSLLDVIERGGGAGTASNERMIHLLKMQIFFPTDHVSSELNFHFDEVQGPYSNVADQVADVETLIEALERRLKQLGHGPIHMPRTTDPFTGPSTADGRSDENGRPVDPSQVAQTPGPSDSSSAGHSPPTLESNGKVAGFDREGESLLRDAVAKLEEVNRKLEGRWEHELSRATDLQKAQREARSFLDTLENMANDLELIATAASPKIRLVSPAKVPRHPLGRSPGFVASVVGAAALPLLVILVFLMNSLGVRPFLGRRRAERSGQA